MTDLSGDTLARTKRLAAMIHAKRLMEARQEQQQLPGGLLAFIRYFWHIIEPGRPFIEGWPLEALCAHLEAITRGEITGEREITRFLANVPPGFMKSLTLNVFWPAWEWGPMGLPHLRYMAFSYAAYLTERDNERFRDILRSRDYQELWGHVFTLTSEGKVRVTNDKMGFKFATSIGGVGTGERGDRVLCLPGSEKILTDKGWLPIGDIVEQRLPVKIAGFDHETQQIVWQDIEAYERNPGNDIVEIECEEGTLRCTGDHPVYTQGQGYARADSLQSGESLVWTRGGFDLPELQRGNPTQTEPPSQVLQLEMPVRRRTEVHARPSHTPVRSLQEPSLSASRTHEASKTRGRVLQSGMLSDMELGCQQPDVHWGNAYQVRSVSKAVHSRAQEYHPLLKAVRRQSTPPEDVGGMASASLLSPLQGVVYSGDQDTEVLHAQMRRHCSRAPHSREGQRTLRAWGSREEVSPWLDQDPQGSNQIPRRGSLSALRHKPRAQTAAGCSSYRLRQDQLGPEQSDHTLPVLPREDARAPQGAGQVETRTVRSVKSVGREDVVYNVRVAPCHNYFASGVLVHNCDDPHHVNQAESETIRKNTVRWFQESMSNRLNSLKDSVIVVIMQRVHEDDVSGAILEEGGWTHLMIPFDYESSRHCVTSIGWSDPRTYDGQTPWDDRFGPEEMAGFRRKVFLWAGQYQQRPAPRGGGILKDEWWQTYEVPPSRSFDFVPIFALAALDTAFKEKEENDYSALTVWYVYDEPKTKQRRIILVDAWKKRLPLHGERVPRNASESEQSYMRRAMPKWGLVEWVNFTCSRRKVSRLVIEDSARGHDVNNELRRVYGTRDWGIRLLPAQGDKWARVHAVVDLFTDEMIYAPGEWVCPIHNKPDCKECSNDTFVWRWREWAEMVITDCSVFPRGAHDDIVDTVSMALKHLRECGLAIRRDEREFEEEELARHRPQQRALYPV